MSIETRVLPSSRSVRTLIKSQRTTKSIKDLKDLRALCVAAAIDMQVLTDLKRKERRYFHRRANDGGGQAPALRWGWRFSRPVARGPVPRECWGARNDGEGQALALRGPEAALL